MKFLIFGCNGMAGHTISLFLKEQGHEVLGFARTKSRFVDSITGDATDTVLIREIIKNNSFDCIVNCIGILNEHAERDKVGAVYLNSLFPHYIAELTEGMDAQVIQMSTDCVFSGARGEYTENDICDGASFYDRTKALGELNDKKNTTFRNSIVGPDIKKEGVGLLNWFMKQEGPVHGYTNVMWTGQTTLQLAKTIETAAMEKIHGLYNMVPDKAISKYDLLCLFNEHIKKNKIDIMPSGTIVSNKSLKRTNWSFDFRIPDYEQMVIELSKWMRAHKPLYPHYCL